MANTLDHLVAHENLVKQATQGVRQATTGELRKLLSKSSVSNNAPQTPAPEVTTEQPDTFTDNEFDTFIASQSDAQQKYNPYTIFSHPAEMLAFCEPNILLGETVLHDWQLETSVFLSNPMFTKKNPLAFYLVACNGSGKDAYVTAPLAVWLALSKPRYKVIITSSSYLQLSTQTEPYIKGIAESLNKKLAEMGVCQKAFSVKKGFVICHLTGSMIKMFVTDEPGKAEGDHPFPDHPEAGMCIIINEAKTITKEIFAALRRCTGYDRWIEISSPGEDSGHFYENVTKSIRYPEYYQDGKKYTRHVDAYECPHIPEAEINAAQEDLEPWLFASAYLAEFYTPQQDSVVITAESLKACIDAQIVYDQRSEQAGGLDLSLGGDETVLVTRHGNYAKHIDVWKIKSAPVLEELINKQLEERKYIKHVTPIYCDVGGLGLPIFQHLQLKGWNVVGITNQSAAVVSKLYRNRVAEDWFNMKTLINKLKIPIPFDAKLRVQLSKRRYLQPRGSESKIKLEEKKEAKSRGEQSPDRADAFILAYINFRCADTSEEAEKRRLALLAKPSMSRVTQQDLLEAMNEQKFAGFTGQGGLDVRRGNQGNKESWLDLAIKDYNATR
jgi:hypothetical protein